MELGLSDAELAADFRTLFASGAIGVAHVDLLARRFVSVNDAVCAVLGYDRAALLAIAPEQLLHPDDRAAYAALRDEVAATGWGTGEARLLTAGGGTLWVRLRTSAVADADGVRRRSVNLVSNVSARRDAELKVREEAERAHLALAAAQAGTWEYRYDPPEMRWSPEVYALYDLEPSAVAPGVDDWLKFVHPDDAEEALRLGRLADTADTYAGAFRVRTRDGGWRWIASRARVIRDAAGKRVRVVGINIDQSERMASEAALTAAAARFRAAIDAMDGVLWTNDAEGQMTGEQPAWAALSGQSYDEYQGYGWSAAVHPDDVAPTVAAWQAAVAARATFVFEHRVRRHDGEWRMFSVRAVPTFDADGGIREWVGVHTDVTDARADARALHDLNDSLATRIEQAVAERNAAWNNARDLLAVIGGDGRIRAVNPAWTATLGWAQDEVVGRYHLDMNHPDDQPSSDAVLHAAQGSTVPNYECRVRHKDGSYRTIAWLLASPDGESVFISGRDVTAERQRQADLEAAQAQLHEMQKLESVGQLTGGVAHDFNNLLTPIIGSLDLLQRRGLGGEREARLIDGALAAADRAKTLVQRLLAFARRQQLQTRATDIVELVDGMRDLIARSIGPEIAIVVGAHDNVPAAQVDAAQLELALLNLALNARDAMQGKGGGTLTIGIDSVVPGPETGLPPRTFVRLCVTDTGHGMDEATLRRAIEPFFSTKGIGKGTGLGLSMVHGLAAQSGGLLVVQSTPGDGTTATLWLPEADRDAPDEPGTSVPVTDAVPAAETLLVVDDEELVRASTAAMLADLGFAVIEAESAAAALAAIEGGAHIDALVTDYLMPGTNGGELVRAARALRPGLPARRRSRRCSHDTARLAPSGAGWNTRQMILRTPVAALAALLLAAPSHATTAYDTRIDRVLRVTPLVDGHNDWPGRLRRAGEGWWALDLAADARKLGPERHTDIPRLRAGRVGGQFWSVYVPATLSGPAAIAATLEQIDIVRGFTARHPDVFEMAYSAADVRRIHKAGRIASLIGVEGGHQIGESLPALRQFYALGARYMTITHSKNNVWADSATDAPANNGLTAFGRAVIGEMNRLGMLVDLSHVSPKTMADALDVSKAPVIFSHSSARALNDHPRNVPDDILRRVAANGGVVMVTWVPAFIDPARFAWEQASDGAAAGFKLRFTGQPERIDAAVAEWRKANPRPVTPLALVADHIDHVAKVAGHDHVGIGADLDGIGDTPEGLDGVDTYPALLAELMRRGWTDAQIAALAGGNVLRALAGAERVAAGLRDTLPTSVTYAPAP